jgi:hypothetical protein
MTQLNYELTSAGLNTTRISVGLAAYLGIDTVTISKEAKVTGVWNICQLILKCTEAKKEHGVLHCQPL